MIAALDDNVGKVLNAIQASGQADRTLIVFASDNGCAAYFPGLCACWPLRGGKLSYFNVFPSLKSVGFPSSGGRRSGPR